VQKIRYIILRILQEIGLFLFRDQWILCYPNLPARKNRVNLNHYHAYFQPCRRRTTDSGARNLGDDLAPCIFAYALSQKALTPESPAKKRTHLYTVGSILLMGYQNTTVWGSGILVSPSPARNFLHRACFRKLDIRCVRGPLTRQALLRLGHQCPEVYGDPGCLMPLIYKPTVEKTLEYLVIPHSHTEQQTRREVPAENFLSLNTDDYQAVIHKICSARKVIASSLHGIILAEAYGVPAIYLDHRPKHFEFKYADWYQSTGRAFGPKASTLAQAIAMDPGAAPDLSEMQQRLLHTFPYDLWEVS
jgi:pyruvyltransferase